MILYPASDQGRVKSTPFPDIFGGFIFLNK
jgi:hypothetical protein